MSVIWLFVFICPWVHIKKVENDSETIKDFDFNAFFVCDLYWKAKLQPKSNVKSMVEILLLLPASQTCLAKFYENRIKFHD